MNISELKNIFADAEIINDKITVKSNIREVLNFVKSTYGFDMLKEIVAIDQEDEEIELIYKLYSVENGEDLNISIVAEGESDSVSDIYDSAVADEKEIYDLFGVKFIGNTELKRLYMPEGWKGNPLKKDYQENDERLSWNE